jgi:acyl transferase domain-containing protein/NAD(P)-dependent dehydrogenase (short-subunit alcohol dehydrogenase family)/acyl carrier protein
MILAMQHGLLPRTLHAETPSPHVDWSAGTVRLLNQAMPWKSNGHPRRAAVSSFGISGTNAHLLLEEAPAIVPERSDSPATAPIQQPLSAWPVLLSAKSETALRAQAQRLREHLRQHEDLSLLDLAFSLAATRTQFEHRAVIVVNDRNELLAALDSLAQGNPTAPNTLLGDSRGGGKLAMLFTGQGSQRPTMGSGLYGAFPVFRETLDAACTLLDRSLSSLDLNHIETLIQNRDHSPSLRDVLFAPEGSPEAVLLDQTLFTQPVLFALEVALYRLLETWGVKPDLLLGHSIGELAAAHISGVLSLEDACSLVAARARLMQALRRDGAMVTLQASEAEVLPLLDQHQGRVSIAALNSPASTVIAGDEEAVLQIARSFEAMGRRTSRLRVSHAFHSPHMDGMLDAFRRAAETISFHPARLPLVSNLSGAPATHDELCSPDYWVSHVRQTVRFVDGVRTLYGEGIRTFLELGPHGVLSALAHETIQTQETNERGADFIPTLRKSRNEVDTLLTALAGLHVRGVPVDWKTFFAPHAPKRVDLPTYAFQRQRFWLDAPRTRHVSAGQSSIDHPFLSDMVPLAGGNGFLFTGRIDLSEHPWLAGHSVFGTVILPGTAFVELALFAAQNLGLNVIEELTLESPLIIPSAGAVLLQIHLASADNAGRRPVHIYSRTEQDASREDLAAWIRHAEGTLAPEGESASFHLSTWPPTGAVPLSMNGFYESLANIGLNYGPGFQGVRSVWQMGADLYAEIQLNEAAVENAGRFAFHPALFDAALHTLALQANHGTIRVPFSWTGLQSRAFSADALRVRIQRDVDGNAAKLWIADEAGSPVAWVQQVALRATSADQLETTFATQRPEALFHLHWTELQQASPASLPLNGALFGVWDFDHLPGNHAANWIRYPDLATLQKAIDQGASAPEIAFALMPGPPPGTEVNEIEAAHHAASRALSLLQAWTADERLASSRLAVVTRRAVAALDGEDVPNLIHASIRGLVRTAQNEHPEFAIHLVDTDGSENSQRALFTALDSSEPQLALREGRRLVPRLSRLPQAGETPQNLDPEGTVLITGGTGTLGSMVARRLVEKHGVRHLLLTSRQGAAAPGAEVLILELQAAGAEASIAACDAADYNALKILLDGIPASHPLTAVVHCAGVLDDGVLQALTPERLGRVFAPKMDAAWNLHQFTRDRDLAAFVLFSSISGILGNPGQANYAAANTFLDALAQHRRANGLAASSLAWGYWEEKSGISGRLTPMDAGRMRRAGILPISSEQGLELLDVCLRRSEAVLIPARFNLGAIANSAKIPILFRELIRGQASRRMATDTSASPLRQDLSSLSPTDRQRALLNLVRSEAAAVLGLSSPAVLDESRSLHELGLDSLMALDLRNRLTARMGTRFPTTLLFDYPTSAALAEFIDSRIARSPQVNAQPYSMNDGEIQRMLASIPIQRLRESGVLDTLLGLAVPASGAAGDSEETDNQIDAIANMSAEEMVHLALGSRGNHPETKS